MDIGKSICDSCFHNGFCDFAEQVYGNWAGSNECPHPHFPDSFLGWVKVKDEYPPVYKDVFLLDCNNIPFVGYYTGKEFRKTEPPFEVDGLPLYWLKGDRAYPEPEEESKGEM